GPESLHGINGIRPGGYGIFRDNYFGHTWGFNDTIDFTGGNRPGPILQVIINVFDGASDDNLDLDSTDAWIERTIFMHVHRAAGSHPWLGPLRRPQHHLRLLCPEPALRPGASHGHHG